VARRGWTEGNSCAVADFAVGNCSASGRAGWEALASAIDFKPGAARVGLTGPELNIRYTRVPRVPDWQLRKLMRFEVEEVGGSSGSEVASDFNVLPELPEIEGEDVVVLAMAKESMLEEHIEGMAQVGGSLGAATPNAIGLYNAWLRFGVLLDDTVLVANIGHENIDVIIARGHDLVFARSLGGGSKLFDEAIAARFSVSLGKAEDLKHTIVDLAPDARYPEAAAEKASRACLGPAGQLLGLLSSTVMFSKSQVKLTNLSLDRVMICGGGAALEGLDRYLARGLNVPVERFDPFGVVDVSALSPEKAALLEDHALESVVALGLATSASDPAAYAIEIVPAAIERRRAFVGGTLFLVASGVLALAYLGWYGMGFKSELGVLETRTAQAQNKFRTANRAHTQAAAFVEENEVLATRAVELFTTAGAGAQLERFVGAIESSTPKDFWITRLVSELASDEDLGVPRSTARPILRVEGKTREGVERTNERFDALVAAVEEALPGAALKDSLSPGNERFVIELTDLAPDREGVAPPPSDEPDDSDL
nr:pilus assembly protein PilM [Planctomycetota bacterium]